MKMIDPPYYFKPHNSDFSKSEIKILFVTTISSSDYISKSPSFWFSVCDDLLYGVCDYEFDFFEDYSDWDNFDYFYPSYYELSKLLELNPKFYELDFDNLDEDEFSEFELKIIKTHKRCKKISQIIS